MALFRKKITSDVMYKGSTNQDVYYILPASDTETSYYFLGMNIYTRTIKEKSDCKTDIENTQNKKLGFK